MYFLVIIKFNGQMYLVHMRDNRRTFFKKCIWIAMNLLEEKKTVANILDVRLLKDFSQNSVRNASYSCHH